EEAAENLKRAYAKLIAIAKASQRQAEQIRDALRRQSEAAATRLVAQFERLLPLVGQTIAQATRRMLDGEVVRARKKILSLFEPHTQAIIRHKAEKPTEFGHKVLLDEVEGSIISRYAILESGNGQDAPYLRTTLE